MLSPGTLELTTNSVEQTHRLGVHLGELLEAGDIVCLSGDLGAGKTAFTQGVGAGWGAAETVTSPTFTLVHEHRRKRDDQRLYHVDCYRLRGDTDALSIGLEEMFHSESVTVMEWPENVRDVLPKEILWIDLFITGDTQRQIALQGIGERYRTLVELFRLRAVSG